MNINNEKPSGENSIDEYKKIFRERSSKDKRDISKETEKIRKENRFMLTFLIQSIICIIIIGCIVAIKYISPDTFISVSSTVSGLYEDNITLSDLSNVINENIIENEAIAAFFNINGVRE